MKKIFLCIAICLVAVFAAQASDKEQIAGLIDTIKKHLRVRLWQQMFQLLMIVGMLK